MNIKGAALIKQAFKKGRECQVLQKALQRCDNRHCMYHGQVDPYPLSHQGSPKTDIFIYIAVILGSYFLIGSALRGTVASKQYREILPSICASNSSKAIRFDNHM